MILAATPQAVTEAAGLLRGGAVVAFPTETVYGLGADVFSPRAVAAIFEIKRRPSFDPLIVHVCDGAMLERVAADLPAAATALIERFWPGPLTLVLPKRSEVPELVTAGLPTVAVRMPAHPVARALIEAAGTPLAAPSANPFGRISPTTAQHVERMLGSLVPLILDGGATEVGIESTIVTLGPRPALLRPGAIAAEAIEAVIGPLERPARDSGVRAPGQFASHYAPATRLRLVEPSEVPLAQRRRAGSIALRHAVEGYAASRVLSPSGDLREAAANLFKTLHELDAMKLERIDAQPVAENGLGVAIMDRLTRAAR
ncbi:MAG TPA: L-threonylcarbamoyladenylate synthase [Candidatus Cybelea sp.]|jgi:L-threonylcarbamoyladenylate synthase|nr:L-threonylcarbamoyladenylate synthase [Candidatus Cybelea sp.]